MLGWMQTLQVILMSSALCNSFNTSLHLVQRCTCGYKEGCHRKLCVALCISALYTKGKALEVRSGHHH